MPLERLKKNQYLLFIVSLLWCPCSFAKSCLIFATPWTAAHQASLSFTISQNLLKFKSIESVMPSHSLLPPSPPAFSLSQHQGLFQCVDSASGGQSIGASASVLPKNIQDWFPLELTVWSPSSPRDSQESSLTQRFKTINSSALSFVYRLTLTSILDYLTSILDYWRNQSFD